MKFLHHLFSSNKPTFDKIEGYEDIKDIVIRALESEESFNLLLWGEPASSKTLFLIELAKQKGSVFFDCTNTRCQADE